jgi:hypothetical protein
MFCEIFPLSCKIERFWQSRKMTSKNRKWPGKTNFDVSLLKYLSDRNKTFTTLIIHIGLHFDKVWRILNFLILHVLPDYYRQPLLRYVKNHVYKQTIKFEDWRTVLEFFESRSFFTKFDLKSGYHHWDIFSEHQPYLGFSWKMNGETPSYFMFTVLPFGLTTAPCILTKLYGL